MAGITADKERTWTELIQSRSYVDESSSGPYLLARRRHGLDSLPHLFGELNQCERVYGGRISSHIAGRSRGLFGIEAVLSRYQRASLC